MTILSGKVATITGASAGIGHATAKLFAREGAKIVIGARRQPELNTLVAEITEAGRRDFVGRSLSRDCISATHHS